MTQQYRKVAAMAIGSAALAVAVAPVAQAKHGADDPPNHEVVHHHKHHKHSKKAEARHHHRHGGRNHAEDR